MPPRTRVLFLTCHLPWPPVSGGRRRELELIRRLGERFDIDLLVISKTPERDRETAPEAAEHCCTVQILPADIPPGDSVAGEVPLELRHRSAGAAREVARHVCADAVDLIHVEGFYLAQHVPAAPGMPLLVVEQNIEWQLAAQRARLASRRRRLAAARGDRDAEHMTAELAGELSATAARTRRAELGVWRRADQLGALTHEDATVIEAAMPGRAVALLPDGCDHLPAAPAAPPLRAEHHAVAFVANFAYEPNVDAALFLCGEILPRLLSREPGCQLWLVGNEPPAGIRALAGEHVRVTGWVPDVAPYLDAASVLLCPLRIGGGIKVKTIEALRRGKALVSTSVGLQGLPAQARAGAVAADSAEDFADAVARLLGDGRLRAQMEQRAAAAARLLPTWDEAAAALADVYDRLANPAAALPGGEGSLASGSMGR